MMRHFLILAAISGFFLAGGAGANSAYAQYGDRYDDDDYEYEQEYEYEYEDGGPQFDMFAELRFYGRWHHISAYGWVWRPYARAGWRPYHHGHWVFTEYGWMWVGYEPFAWAAYHYGNWTYHPRMGWIWVPGYEWAPCHVEWIVYDDYVSWAPRPPRHVHIGYPWSVNPVNVWITVRADHFTDPNVWRYSSRPKFKAEYAERVARHDAPEVRYVERIKGRPVSRVDVQMTKSKAGDREVTHVRLPAEQTWIREQNRVKMQSKAQYESSRSKQHPKQREMEPSSKQRVKQPARESSRQPGKESSKEPAKQKSQSEKKKKGSRGKD